MKLLRIQRQRTKGWRMPDNTVYVGRPGKWCNPFPVTLLYRNSRGESWCVDEPFDFGGNTLWGTNKIFKTRREAHQCAVDLFEALLHDARYPLTHRDVLQLRGKNLACWCPLDLPCHADLLLELANGE